MPEFVTARIRERDVVIPSLRLAAARPSGYISTTDLIVELTDMFQPEGEDAEVLQGRRDTKFSQIVRNLVSHRGARKVFSGADMRIIPATGYRSPKLDDSFSSPFQITSSELYIRA